MSKKKILRTFSLQYSIATPATDAIIINWLSYIEIYSLWCPVNSAQPVQIIFRDSWLNYSSSIDLIGGAAISGGSPTANSIRIQPGGPFLTFTKPILTYQTELRGDSVGIRMLFMSYLPTSYLPEKKLRLNLKR